MHEVWFHPDLSRKMSPLGSSPFHYSASITLRCLKDRIAAKHPQFRGYQENDAQELLRHLIGDLHAEMKPSRKPLGSTIPKDETSLSNLRLVKGCIHNCTLG